MTINNKKYTLMYTVTAGQNTRKKLKIVEHLYLYNTSGQVFTCDKYEDGKMIVKKSLLSKMDK